MINSLRFATDRTVLSLAQLCCTPLAPLNLKCAVFVGDYNTLFLLSQS